MQQYHVNLKSYMYGLCLFIGRSYVDSYMLPCEPSVPLLVNVKVPEVAPIQQLLDKTEYLNQSSSGIHILLDGTKEELWPVYGIKYLHSIFIL